MFIGHFAPALVASAASSRAPRLGTLFLAAQLVDLAFLGLFMTGVEKARVVPGLMVMSTSDFYHMPFTHSLLGTAVAAAGFGGLVTWLARSVAAGGWAAAVVLSHWFIDLLVHRPVLTLAGQPPKFGMGLWNYPLVEVPLELAMVGIGFWMFLTCTRGPRGPALFLLAVLLIFQAISWLAPQPTEYSSALPLTAFLAFTILILPARWVGTTRRHRRAAGLAMASSRR